MGLLPESARKLIENAAETPKLSSKEKKTISRQFRDCFKTVNPLIADLRKGEAIGNTEFRTEMMKAFRDSQKVADSLMGEAGAQADFAGEMHMELIAQMTPLLRADLHSQRGLMLALEGFNTLDDVFRKHDTVSIGLGGKSIAQLTNDILASDESNPGSDGRNLTSLRWDNPEDEDTDDDDTDGGWAGNVPPQDPPEPPNFGGGSGPEEGPKRNIEREGKEAWKNMMDLLTDSDGHTVFIAAVDEKKLLSLEGTSFDPEYSKWRRGISIVDRIWKASELFSQAERAYELADTDAKRETMNNLCFELFKAASATLVPFMASLQGTEYAPNDTNFRIPARWAKAFVRNSRDWRQEKMDNVSLRPNSKGGFTMTAYKSGLQPFERDISGDIRRHDVAEQELTAYFQKLGILGDVSIAAELNDPRGLQRNFDKDMQLSASGEDRKRLLRDSLDHLTLALQDRNGELSQEETNRSDLLRVNAQDLEEYFGFRNQAIPAAEVYVVNVGKFWKLLDTDTGHSIFQMAKPAATDKEVGKSTDRLAKAYNRLVAMRTALKQTRFHRNGLATALRIAIENIEKEYSFAAGSGGTVVPGNMARALNAVGTLVRTLAREVPDPSLVEGALAKVPRIGAGASQNALARKELLSAIDEVYVQLIDFQENEQAIRLSKAALRRSRKFGKIELHGYEEPFYFLQTQESIAASKADPHAAKSYILASKIDEDTYKRMPRCKFDANLQMKTYDEDPNPEDLIIRGLTIMPDETMAVPHEALVAMVENEEDEDPTAEVLPVPPVSGEDDAFDDGSANSFDFEAPLVDYDGDDASTLANVAGASAGGEGVLEAARRESLTEEFIYTMTALRDEKPRFPRIFRKRAAEYEGRRRDYCIQNAENIMNDPMGIEARYLEQFVPGLGDELFGKVHEGGTDRIKTNNALRLSYDRSRDVWTIAPHDSRLGEIKIEIYGDFSGFEVINNVVDLSVDEDEDRATDPGTEVASGGVSRRDLLRFGGYAAAGAAIVTAAGGTIWGATKAGKVAAGAAKDAWTDGADERAAAGNRAEELLRGARKSAAAKTKKAAPYIFGAIAGYAGVASASLASIVAYANRKKIQDWWEGRKIRKMLNAPVVFKYDDDFWADPSDANRTDVKLDEVADGFKQVLDVPSANTPDVVAAQDGAVDPDAFTMPEPTLTQAVAGVGSDESRGSDQMVAEASEMFTAQEDEAVEKKPNVFARFAASFRAARSKAQMGDDRLKEEAQTREAAVMEGLDENTVHKPNVFSRAWSALSAPGGFVEKTKRPVGKRKIAYPSAAALGLGLAFAGQHFNGQHHYERDDLAQTELGMELAAKNETVKKAFVHLKASADQDSQYLSQVKSQNGSVELDIIRSIASDSAQMLKELEDEGIAFYNRLPQDVLIQAPSYRSNTNALRAQLQNNLMQAKLYEAILNGEKEKAAELAKAKKSASKASITAKLGTASVAAQTTAVLGVTEGQLIEGTVWTKAYRAAQDCASGNTVLAASRLTNETMLEADNFAFLVDRLESKNGSDAELQRVRDILAGYQTTVPASTVSFAQLIEKAKTGTAADKLAAAHVAAFYLTDAETSSLINELEGDCRPAAAPTKKAPAAQKAAQEVEATKTPAAETTAPDKSKSKSKAAPVPTPTPDPVEAPRPTTPGPAGREFRRSKQWTTN